jgi:hypothetical protein
MKRDYKKMEVDSQSDIANLDLDDEEYYLKEVLLAKYARKLLQSRQIKALFDFSLVVDHDLRSWFYREKSRTMVLTDAEFANGSLLSSLHEQFGLPYPRQFEFTEELETVMEISPSEPANDASRTSSSSSLYRSVDQVVSPPTLRKSNLSNTVPRLSPRITKSHGPSRSPYRAAPSPKKMFSSQGTPVASRIDGPRYARARDGQHSRRSSHGLFSSIEYSQPTTEMIKEDLAYILDELLAVNLSEWALLFATMIQAVDVIVALFEDFPESWLPYRHLLSLQLAEGYVQLSDHLKSRFESPRPSNASEEKS